MGVKIFPVPKIKQAIRVWRDDVVANPGDPSKLTISGSFQVENDRQAGVNADAELKQLLIENLGAQASIQRHATGEWTVTIEIEHLAVA